MLRPQNNDAASRLQRTVDRLVERLPRRNLSVPPYRPAILGKCIGEQFSLILICSRITDENITHVAMMIACPRQFNPNCALHVAVVTRFEHMVTYSSGKGIAKLRSLRAYLQLFYQTKVSPVRNSGDNAHQVGEGKERIDAAHKRVAETL